MADESPVDIKLSLEKKCLEEHCQHDVHLYQACCERIKKVDPAREPHCYPQYFEVVHCVDHCVHPQLWKTLK